MKRRMTWAGGMLYFHISFWNNKTNQMLINSVTPEQTYMILRKMWPESAQSIIYHCHYIQEKRNYPSVKTIKMLVLDGKKQKGQEQCSNSVISKYKIKMSDHLMLMLVWLPVLWAYCAYSAALHPHHFFVCASDEYLGFHSHSPF